MANTIAVRAVMDARGVSRGVDQANGRLSGLARTAGRVGAAVAAAFSIRAIARGTAAVVRSASEQQQSIGGVESVFKRHAATVEQSAARAANAVGLSATEYRTNATLIGSLFKNQGVEADKLAGKTDKLVRVGADLAATYGGTAKESVEALASAYKGEYDPLERYGISLKQSEVNAVLAAKGQDKLTGAALRTAQQQAITRLIMQQSADAQGQFARESNTFAGVQARATAAWGNLSSTIGTALLPVLTAAGNTLVTRVLPPMQQLADKYAPIVSAKLSELATAAGPKITAALSAAGDALARFRADPKASADVSSIAQSVGQLGPIVRDAAAALPSFSDLLSVTSTVMKFAADNTGLLSKALPFLVAGYVAVKAAQVAANAAAVLAVPTKVAEVVVNRQLVASNRALIASRTGLTAATVSNTAAENVGTASRARSLVGMVAQRVAMVATTVATRAWAATQWLLNAALTANPIGLVVVAIAALVAGLIYAYKNSETFRNIVQSAMAKVRAVVTAAMPVVKRVIETVLKGVVAYARVFGAVWGAIFRAALATARFLSSGVRAAGALVRTALTLIVTGARNMASGIRTAVTNAIGFVRDLPNKARAALSNASSLLVSAGRNLVQGMINGIQAMAGRVAAKARELASNAVSTIKNALKIASPSRVMITLGRFIGQGLAIGMTGTLTQVRSAANRLTNGIVDAFNDYRKSRGSLEQRIKDQTARLRRASKDARPGILRQIRQTRRDLAELDDAYGGPRTSRGLQRLLASTNRTNAKLRTIAVRREDVAKRLKAAQAALAAAIKQRDDYANNVTGSALSFGSITSIEPGENESLTANTLVQGLRDRLNAITNYRTKLAALTKKGLNKQTYDQLVQAGVEGGTAAVEALTAGGSVAIRQVNSLQAQIGTQARTLGTTTANDMYGAGVRAAQGLVRGLESQSAKLIRQATALARKLTKAVKKALKIKSPSRVWQHEIGDQIKAGLRISLLDDRDVVRASAKLGQAVTDGFDVGSLTADATVAASSGGPRPITIERLEVKLDAAMSQEQMGRQYKRAIAAFEAVGG